MYSFLLGVSNYFIIFSRLFASLWRSLYQYVTFSFGPWYGFFFINSFSFSCVIGYYRCNIWIRHFKEFLMGGGIITYCWMRMKTFRNKLIHHKISVQNMELFCHIKNNVVHKENKETFIFTGIQIGKKGKKPLCTSL